MADKKRVNLIIGRFQPFTLGHMKCIDYAWEKQSLPSVIALINTPDEKVDEKHPFPSSMLLPIYDTLFEKNPRVLDIVLVKNANIVSIGEELYKRGYVIASWTCGTDRLASYEKMANKYAEVSHLEPDFTMLEVPRSDEDISATKVRQALLDDDKATFNRLTPYNNLRLHLNGQSEKIYELLRKQIMKIIK